MSDTQHIAISQAGMLLKPNTQLMVGFWKLSSIGNLYIKTLGLHWVKAGLPQQPIKLNSSKPALWAGVWTGSGQDLIGVAGDPLVSVGLEGVGFNGALPYTLYDFNGPDSIWAALVNNTTNLPMYVSLTGVANWVISTPLTTIVGTQTTPPGYTVITNTPDQVIV
jgi:hypothetical protein